MVHEDLLYERIRIGLGDLFIGLQCALITVPINMLIVLIFRNAGPRDPVLGERVVINYETRRSPSDEHKGDGDGDDDDDDSDDTDDDTDDHTDDHTGDHTGDHPGDDTDDDTDDDDDDDTDDEDDNDDDDDTSNNDKGLDLGDKEDDSDSNELDVSVTPPVRLPWWFIYIGWTLTISICVLSSFIVLMYGLSYGYNRSVSWLASFVASATTNIGVIQPLKVAVIAVVMTFLLRSPVKPVIDFTYLINQGRLLLYFTHTIYLDEIIGSNVVTYLYLFM